MRSPSSVGRASANRPPRNSNQIEQIVTPSFRLPLSPIWGSTQSCSLPYNEALAKLYKKCLYFGSWYESFWLAGYENNIVMRAGVQLIPYCRSDATEIELL